MVFTDPFIPLHELPRIRLWEELRDHIIDRRDLSWLVRAWGYDPYPPAIPSIGDTVWRLLRTTSNVRQHIDWVGEELMDKDDMVEGPDIPQLKTVAKLHLDAFGYDSTGWDDPDAPPILTQPCSMHYRAWDDIRKMVLEVDKHWYAYPAQVDGFATMLPIQGYYYYSPSPLPRFSTWTAAKQNALSNMEYDEGYDYHYVGRNMHGYQYTSGTNRYTCTAHSRETYRASNMFGWDVSSLIEVPTLARVFIAIRWSAYAYTHYRSPIPIDVYIGGIKCNSSPFQLDGTTTDTQFYLFELDDFDQSNYTFDGATYDVDIRYADPLSEWVDDTEFPAPASGEAVNWYCRIRGKDPYDWYLDWQLAVKMFYLFDWP